MNEHMPSISVIIPVYNKEKYLSRCIESVLGQTFDDLEVLLIDDGSTDGSLDVCRKYEKMDGRVRVFHTENRGVSNARNYALDCARGEFIAFADADDWLDRQMYERLHNLISRYEADIASVSYILAKTEEDSVHKKKYEERVYNKTNALQYYLNVGLSSKVQDYSVWTKLYKKELFREIHFAAGQLYEDMLINLQLLLTVQRYVKSEEPLYYYYQGDGSITRDKLKMRDFDLYKTYREIRALIYKNQEQVLFKLADEVYARTPMSLLIKACVYGIDSSVAEPQKVISFLKKDLRKHIGTILGSPLPKSRKAASLVLCICPGAVKYIMDIYRRGK